MTLILTNLSNPFKQVRDYILKERIKNHCIDSLCFTERGRLIVGIFFYDDRSIGVYVKSKLTLSQIRFCIKEFKKKILSTSGNWFCMCKNNVKSGNKLAKLCGFKYEETLNRYNIYVW